MFSVTVLIHNKLNTSPHKHKHVSSHQCYFLETAVNIHPWITQLSMNMKEAPSMYLPQHKDSAVSTSRECDEMKFRSEWFVESIKQKKSWFYVHLPAVSPSPCLVTQQLDVYAVGYCVYAISQVHQLRDGTWVYQFSCCFPGTVVMTACIFCACVNFYWLWDQNHHWKHTLEAVKVVVFPVAIGELEPRFDYRRTGFCKRTNSE